LRDDQQAGTGDQVYKTVAAAGHDVVNALGAYALNRNRRGRLKAHSEHSRKALALARTRLLTR